MRVTTIQIGLVEKNTLSRETLVYALMSQPDFQVKFSVASVDEVPNHMTPPDVILFSTWYPSEVFSEEMSIDYWRIRMPHSRLVLLTANKMRAIIEILIDQGIEGYIIRQEADTQAVFEIVRCAAYGHQTVCKMTRAILANPRIEKDLTRREIQVIRLLHNVGISNRKQVASALGISALTVNQHLKNVFEKLGVGDVIDLMDRSRAMGILEPDRM